MRHIHEGSVRKAGDTIRIWTASIATGEEAYTIAMLFIEAFECERRWPNLKIFATDVDQQCIETAGIGQYPESAAAELSPERLERFFVKKGDSFVIKNELRQCIVFARHNLLADPPFTKMDLVVCRNTLIYFKSAAQERALRSLQYSIRQGGALLLGSSESLSAVSEGLQAISSKYKIFRRTGTPTLPFMDRKGSVLSPSLTLRAAKALVSVKSDAILTERLPMPGSRNYCRASRHRQFWFMSITKRCTFTGGSGTISSPEKARPVWK